MSILESTRDGGVLHLVLNRPAKRNALDSALCRELVEALEGAEASPDTHAVLLTAAGPSFCAGMDLAEALNPADPEAIDALHERLFTIGTRLTIPIVTAVQGSAIAGGTGLVANCHVVVAAPDAAFGLTEIRIGLWPFLVFRACAAAMGERRCVELALTGRSFAAPEAQELGLVHEIAADPAARAAEIARQIAGANPVAIRKGLGAVHQSMQMARAARKEVLASKGFRDAIQKYQRRES